MLLSFIRGLAIYLVTTLFFINSASAYHFLLRPKAAISELSAYEIEVGGSYWQTTALYDVDGNEVALGEAESFDMVEGHANLRYAYGKQIQFFGGLDYRQNRSETETQSNTVSGLESYHVGVKYLFKPIKKWRYSGEFEFRQTAYSNSEYLPGEAPENDLVLGDDGNSIKIGGYVSYLRKRDHFLNGYLAYHSPSNNLSDELPYFIESYWAFKNWGLFVGLSGVYSLGQDEFTAEPERKPDMSTGATNLFNSINREYYSPYVGAEYAKNRWKVGAKYRQVMGGISTDQGQEVLVNFTWSSEGVSKEEMKIAKFKEYLIEAFVTKVSPRGAFIKIDKGFSSDVTKGMRFDIFEIDFKGGNELVATGIVYESKSDWSIVKIVKRYKNKRVKKDFVARGY